MHTDAGYGSGDNIVMAREQHGTELKAPIGSNESEKHLPLREFEFDAQKQQVLRCPRREAPLRHEQTRNGKATLVEVNDAQTELTRARLEVLASADAAERIALLVREAPFGMGMAGLVARTGLLESEIAAAAARAPPRPARARSCRVPTGRGATIDRGRAAGPGLVGGRSRRGGRALPAARLHHAAQRHREHACQQREACG